MPITATLDKDQALAIVNALRAGTVPHEGLAHYAVGLEPQMNALSGQMNFVAGGRSAYKFVRGEYGSGKTFLTSMLAATAPSHNFLYSKVVVSSTDVPLYRLVEVYRRACLGLSTSLRSVLDRWLFSLEEKVIELQGISEDDPGFADAVQAQVDEQLLQLGDQSGRLAACLGAYHRSQLEQDYPQARALLDWISGESKVAASMKKVAGVTGRLENSDALVFLRGLLEIIRAAGFGGLVLVLDEVETVLRLRRPERQKSLEVLRQLIDACDRHEFPGLYLLFTGTPDFFDSPQGVPALQPLHDRIKVQFEPDRPENLRAPQIRLSSFDYDRLLAVARKVRDLYPATFDERVNDEALRALAESFTTGFGGRVDVIPRLFLRHLVEVLDLVEQYPDYQPLEKVEVSTTAMTAQEEQAFSSQAREVCF